MEMEKIKSEVKIFENTEFGELRVCIVGDAPLFIAKDIAASLGYVNTQKAILDHCRRITKRDVPCKSGSYTDRSGNIVEIIKDTTVNLIPESDVYRLIMRSNLPDAEKFQDWVCDEVLPAIRRNGAYISEAITEEQDQYRHEKAVIEMIRGKKKIGKRLMSIWKNMSPHQIKMSAMYILDNTPAGIKKQGIFESISGVTKQLERDYRDPAKNSDYDPNVSVQFRSDLFYPITEELVKFNNRSHGQKVRHIEGKTAQSESIAPVVLEWVEKCRVIVPVKLSTKNSAPDRKVSFGVSKLYLHFSLYARPEEAPIMRVAMGTAYQSIGELRDGKDFIEVGELRLKYDFTTHEAVVLHKR